MAERKINPIFDTHANIQDFNTYSYIEGQVFFANDTKKLYQDKNGQRVLKTNLNSIEVYDQGLTEFYQRGTAGFEGELVLAKSGDSFKLFYVDSDGNLNPIGADTDELLEYSQNQSNGFNNFTLNFYAVTDKEEDLISSILEPENISGNIDFTTLEITNLTFDQPVGGPIWTTNIADLEGEWVWNGSRYVLSSNSSEIERPNAKIIVSKVALFSNKTSYSFSGLSGDNPSLFVKEGLNQKTVFLYQGTSEESAPSTPSNDLLFNFETNAFVGGIDTNGWSLGLVGINNTNNRYVWITGAAVASNIKQAVIGSEDWSTPELFERFAEDGEQGPPGEDGAEGPPGPPGPPGDSGTDGKRTTGGLLYYQVASTTAPSSPNLSGVEYTISTNSFSGLPANWEDVPPVFTANESNKYWYVRWNGVETSPDSDLINSFSLTSPSQAINFDGVVTFTDSGNGELSVTNSNITKINGGLLETAVIQSLDYVEGLPEDDPFSSQGLKIDFNNEEIISPSIFIDGVGNANFKGIVSADSGNIGDWNISNGWLVSSDANSSSTLTDSTLILFNSDFLTNKKTTLDPGKLEMELLSGGTAINTDYTYSGITISSPTSNSTFFEINNATSGINLTVPSFSTINLNGEVVFDSANYGTSAPSGSAAEGQIYFQHE